MQVLLLAVSAALVVRILIEADLRRVAELIGRSGWTLAFAVFPYLVGVAIDTRGWGVLLGGLGYRIRFLELLRLRLSTEAVLLSAPFGAVGAESLKGYLLERRFSVSLADAVATIGAKKALLAVALGLYLVTSAAVGHDYLARASQAIIGGGGLPWLVAAAGVLLATLAVLIFASSRLSSRWLSDRWPSLRTIDARLSRLGSDRPRMARTIIIFYAGWLVETAESFLLLSLVGADISLPQLVALEATVSLIRAVAVFAPAGLGVQDASYLGFFAAVGVPDAATVGAAFLVLKRAKELLWVVAGYLLLVADRSAATRTTPAEPEATPIAAADAADRRPRVLFICGSLHQTRQMRAIRAALGDAIEAWFTPYYCDGYLTIFRAFGFLEMSIAGRRLQARCRSHLWEHDLPIDEGGRRGGYDLVVTCSDIVVPRNIRGVPLVAVQEGMTDPENALFHLYRRLPRLVPRWLPGTSTTGMSGLYDKMCVASEGYKRFFSERKGADPRRLEVTGIPLLDDCARFLDNPFPYRGYVLVCTSDKRETFRAEDRPAFLDKAARIAAGQPVIFKLHPNEQVERATREIRAVIPDALVFSDGVAEEMIANCDVLVCQLSTTAYVGLALGKEVHSDFDVDELRELCPLQNGGTSARAIADVCRRMLAAHAPESAVSSPILGMEEVA